MTTAARLMTELQGLGVTLAADGDRLRFSPRSAVTGELLQRLRDCKAELLAMLASGPQPGDNGNGYTTRATTGETAVVSPKAPQDPPGGDPHGADGPQDPGPSDIDAGEWQEVTDADGRRCLVRSDAADVEIIDARPCPVCGGIVFWWDVAGGAHCERCSPATPTGQRLRQRAAELRERYPVARDADLQPRPVTVPRTWPAAVPTEIIADPIRACSDCGRPRSVVPGQPGRPAGLCFNCWSKRA